MQRYSGFVLRKIDDPEQGNIAEGVTIEVRNKSDNLIADLFSDPSGTIPKENPMVSDTNGKYFFYAADGGYIIDVADGSDNLEVQLITREDITAEIEASTQGLVDDLATTGGANSIGTEDGRTVQERFDDLPSEIDAAGTAEILVSEHNSDPSAHPDLSAFITSEADRAETAADVAMAAGWVYATKEDGEAVRADGDYFWVVSSNDENVLDLYLMGASVATATGKSTLSIHSVDDIKQTLDIEGYREPPLFQWIADNKRVLAIGEYGDLQPSSYSDLMVFSPANEISEYHNLRVISQILSSDGKIIERALSDGTLETFGESSSPVPTPSTSDQQPVYAGYRIREFRRIRQELKSGLSSKLNVACIGDSWTDNRAYWLEAVSTQLKEKYGNGGQFFGAGGLWGGGGDTLSGTLSSDASWTAINFTVPTPHLRALESSVVGAKLSLTDAEGESAAISFLGGSGVARYRWASGSWESIALDGSGTQWRDLSTPPSGTSLLEVEVVSGTCRVYGILLNNSSGISLYKMAAASTRAQQWADVNRQDWIDAITPLEINIAIIMFGTNDIYSYGAGAFVAEYLPEIVSRVREAFPNADILISSPPVNLATNVPTNEGQNLPAFAEQSRVWSSNNDAAHLDLQFYFGQAAESYGDSGRQYIISSDPYHPTNKGAAVIAESILTTLEFN